MEQAAAMGWVEIEKNKPRVDRLSQMVRVSETLSAKLPPWRAEIEREISTRHWWFALRSYCQSINGGSSRFWLIQSYVDAYQRTYGTARSRAGARASMSRLLRHPDVKAARAWFYAQINNRVPHDEPMPTTAAAIWRSLKPIKIVLRRE